jgi:glutamate-1-semialdehyde aminotransferase
MSQNPKINFRALRMTDDSLTDIQRKYVAELSARYAKKTAASKKWAADNRQVFCDWINSLCFKKSVKEMIYPIISESSQGAGFTDIDGNKYVDISMGYGSVFLGHNPDFQKKAIIAQAEKGYELGPQMKLSAEVARLVCELTGAERAAFLNSGTEAVMTALRIARAVTGKDKVFLFRNSFHGTFDGVLGFTANSTTPLSPGTTAGMVDGIELLDYGTDEAFQRIRDCIHECAAVLVEPVQSRKPDNRPIKFLQNIRKLTAENNTALIFDEVVNGFRLHPAGAQHIFDIQADLVVYGKSFGNGMPISAVAGKSRFMDAIDGGQWAFGDDSAPQTDVIFYAGTYFKHPLSLAAAKAVLTELKNTGSHHQDKASETTDYICSTLNRWFDENKVPINIKYFGSMFRFESFGAYALHLEPLEMELMFFNMILRGVYTWERRICYLSSAHEKNDADIIINAVKESVEDIRSGGFSFSI